MDYVFIIFSLIGIFKVGLHAPFLSSQLSRGSFKKFTDMHKHGEYVFTKF